MKHHVIMAVGYVPEKVFHRGDLVDFANESVPREIWERWEKAGIIESESAMKMREQREKTEAQESIDADLAALQEDIESDMRETFPVDFKDVDDASRTTEE